MRLEQINCQTQQPIQFVKVSEKRGLSRVEAACYVGISPTYFDQLVKTGKMPKSYSLGTRRLWDRRRLDETIDELSGDDVNPWDSLTTNGGGN